MRDVRQRNRLLVVGLLLLPALALPLSWLYAQPGRPAPPAAPAEEILRFSRNIAGDTKPIQLAADEVFAWTENNDQHFLLRGQVLIQHGVFLMRAQQAVVFVDMASYKARGICRAEIYAEGGIQFDNSNENKEAPRAAIELHTRGEIKVHSAKARLNPQRMGNDPLVITGRGLRKPVEIPRLQSTPPTLAQPVALTPYVAPGGAIPGSSQPVSGIDGAMPRGPGALPGLSSPITPLPAIPVGPAATPGIPYTPPGGALPALGPPVLPQPGPSLPPSPPPRGSDARPAQPGDEALQRTAYQEPKTQPAPATGRAVSAPPVLVVAEQPFAPAPLAPLAPPPNVGRPPPLPALTVPDLPDRRLAISPRGAAGFGLGREMLPTNEQALVVTGGVILNIRGAPKVDIIDLEADRLVIISKKTDPQDFFNGMRSPEGQKQNPDVEFYLAGNVEIRQPGPQGETRTIRADEVYYDIKRNVAIALKGSIEIRDPRLEVPIIARAEEIIQTSTTTFEVQDAEFFASRLPSDPGLKVYVAQAKIEERKIPRAGLFGQTVDRKTGRPLEQTQTWVTATDVWFELEGIPVFYTPYLAGDARDPLGPVEDIRFGYNRIFGAQLGVTLNIYDLLGVQAYEGTRWSFLFDGLTERGAGLGSNFTYNTRDMFDIPGLYEGTVRSYGLFDHGVDNIGGFRVTDREPTDLRGRTLWRHGAYEMPYGFQFQSQIAYLTDRNFLEQYFRQEFDNGLPQDSYLYLKQQQDNWAWSVYANYRLRDWVTETENLPRVDGYLLGQSLSDLFVYNTNVNAGYYRLRISDDPLPVINPVTDVETDTGRIDWWQELAMPLQLGPVNIVPYARLDLTGYTEDLTGETTGRLIGGGGIRASLPLSRLDADVQNDLLNLNGLHHKMVFSTNWYIAESTDPYTRFAQLDRVHMDISDQQVKEIRHIYPGLLGATKAASLSSDLFDPQRHAIRRLIDNRVDTRDDIHVVQFQWANRWQTKRGFPGSQHIVDWITLDLGASFFPDKDRDNFGEPLAFLEYDFVWNVGDRNAFVSNAWVDPIEGGARVFNFGSFYNRPDGTSIYLGYRHIDPLESRAIIASMTYTFSPKYSGTASIMYDFGADKAALNQMFVFNRVGTDLTVSLGVNYNALQNNFGVIFQVVPNLLPRTNTNVAGLGQAGVSRGIN